MGVISRQTGSLGSVEDALGERLDIAVEVGEFGVGGFEFRVHFRAKRLELSVDARPSGSTAGVGEDRGVELTQENFVEEMSSAHLEACTVYVLLMTSLGGQEFAMEGDAALAKDNAEREAVLTVDTSVLGDDPSEESMDLRLVDQKFYVNLGETTDGDFYRIDLVEEGEPEGTEFAAILDQADALKQIEILGASATAREPDGDGGEVDGVSTMRYVLSVDPEVMYEA